MVSCTIENTMTAEKTSCNGAESSITLTAEDNPLSSPGDLDEWNNDSFDMVFGIDLLREKIVDFVIHDGEEVSRRNATTCRLVQRRWLESVHKCLIRKRTPLLELRVINRNDLSPESRVSMFVEAYASPSGTSKSVPPYSLLDVLSDPRFLENTLPRFVHWCASGVISLHLTITNKSVRLFIPENASFPVLQELRLRFFHEDPEPATHALFYKDTAADIQLIFSGCSRLTHLSLEVLAGCMTNGFKTLSMPRTIQNLKFKVQKDIVLLKELMLNSKLPKLTELHLEIGPVSFIDQDLIYRMLRGVSLTLKTMNIVKCGGFAANSSVFSIYFPLMKCLESLDIFADYWDWGNGVNCLGNNLPVVKNITLRGLTPTLLRGLVNNRFGSAKKLTLNFSRFIDYSVEEIAAFLARVPPTLPKVSELDIGTFIQNDNPRIFQSIFQNMPQLKKFYLGLMESADSVIVADQFWTMMFLGRSPEEISADKPADVTHLSELQALHLHFTPANLYSPTNRLPDAVYEYGFRRMPKLTEVSFVVGRPSCYTRVWQDVP